jgi:hypothetical protein
MGCAAHNVDMSAPRHQRPGCFLTAVTGLALFAFVVAASAAPRELTESIHEIVPRQVQVAVAVDHVWASVRLSLRPADLGLSSWVRWDADGDGELSASERSPLALHLRARETEFLALMVDGVAVPMTQAKWRFEASPSASLALDEPATLRIETRENLRMTAGEHRFVLYDRPAEADGIVPIRFSLANGLTLGPVTGARAEKRSPRRLEAVVSRGSPAVWGSFVREGAP